MNNIESYYNYFYKELSKFDEAENNYSKIESFIPKLLESSKFLDIGCGHGSVTSELIDKGFKGYGIEINNDALKSLLDKGFIPVKHDISNPLPFESEFDVVFLLDVLEHVFNPFFLLSEAKRVTKQGGLIIISVPLYFDILDRLKILFTGSIISMDNLCYGEENYKKFRSFNYDHIRFFRPKDILEMGESLELKLDKFEYGASGYAGKCKILRFLVRIFINKYTVNLNPNLLSHSMKIRWIVN